MVKTEEAVKSISLERVVTQEDVKAFLEATSDTNPLHRFNYYAAKAGFANLVVPAMYLVGVYMATTKPHPRNSCFTFKGPLYIGDKLNIESNEESAILTGNGNLIAEVKVKHPLSQFHNFDSKYEAMITDESLEKFLTSLKLNTSDRDASSIYPSIFAISQLSPALIERNGGNPGFVNGIWIYCKLSLESRYDNHCIPIKDGDIVTVLMGEGKITKRWFKPSYT
mgnify:CR=1 FL=1